MWQLGRGGALVRERDVPFAGHGETACCARPRSPAWCFESEERELAGGCGSVGECHPTCVSAAAESAASASSVQARAAARAACCCHWQSCKHEKIRCWQPCWNTESDGGVPPTLPTPSLAAHSSRHQPFRCVRLKDQRAAECSLRGHAPPPPAHAASCSAPSCLLPRFFQRESATRVAPDAPGRRAAREALPWALRAGAGARPSAAAESAMQRCVASQRLASGRKQQQLMAWQQPPSVAARRGALPILARASSRTISSRTISGTSSTRPPPPQKQQQQEQEQEALPAPRKQPRFDLRGLRKRVVAAVESVDPRLRGLILLNCMTLLMGSNWCVSARAHARDRRCMDPLHAVCASSLDGAHTTAVHSVRRCRVILKESNDAFDPVRRPLDLDSASACTRTFTHPHIHTFTHPHIHTAPSLLAHALSRTRSPPAACRLLPSDCVHVAALHAGGRCIRALPRARARLPGRAPQRRGDRAVDGRRLPGAELGARAHARVARQPAEHVHRHRGALPGGAVGAARQAAGVGVRHCCARRHHAAGAGRRRAAKRRCAARWRAHACGGVRACACCACMRSFVCRVRQRLTPPSAARAAALSAAPTQATC